MQPRKNVENIGEAISVLVQVAQLAQKSGILSFDDAVVTKSAIDFLNELNKQNDPEVQEPQSEQGPQ
jgi:flagellar motor component MotA